MAKAKKFGTFGGVFTPSILSILGVIMFLRLPWIVGQAGLWSTLGIILVAHVISLSTGLSVASVATNKRVGIGGVYYIISRTLGLPIGGTMGMALFIGLSLSISLYLIGFSESFLTYFGFEVSPQTIRIAGSVVLFLVAVISYISTSLTIRTQYLIMAILAVSLLSVFVGRHDFDPGAPLLAPAGEVLPWIVLFAIFFPAVTGFGSGVSMSGDLKNPNQSIPIGIISAILVGLLIYVGLAIFFAFTVDRSLLLYDSKVLYHISWMPQLVIAGILGATLSSAFGSILAAPRNLQSMAIDRVLPSILGRGYGILNEPRNALILTYLIAQAGILIGELNVIARLVTIFFIITYGFLNITYALESWAGTDFRPSFKIPRIISIVGALACIIVMIQLDVIAMIVASVVLILLFLYLKRKELTLQTGDTWNSIWTSLVKTGLGRLTLSNRKPSNWRPNVLLFSGGESTRPHLVEMGKSLVGKLGIFTNFELIEEPNSDNLYRKSPEPVSMKPTTKAGVFIRYHECRNIYEGIDMISKVYGFSGFEPNTILMGWGRKTRNPEKFAGLLYSFRRQDLNAVFLSYSKEIGFGQFRSIDVWWSGRGRNLSFASTLLKFLTSSKEWRGAQIRFLMINKDTSITDSLYSLINQVLDNQRINATVKIINNSVEQLPTNEIIHAESRKTDLCILELPDFNREDPGMQIDQVNKMTASLGSCLLISSSAFFDELMVKERKPVSLQSAESGLVKPVADIVSQLKPASREIISNEVSNIGTKAQTLSEAYFTNGFEAVMEQQSKLLPEVGYLADRIFSHLGSIIDDVKPAEKKKALLKLLNDFSFHSQKLIQRIRDDRQSLEKETIRKANGYYISALQQAMVEVPEKIWIKRKAHEFRIDPGDSISTRLYKLRKRLQATMSGKPVPHKINLQPAARYFLLHRRLDLLLGLMQEFTLKSFQQITDIRKLLVSVHEAIEKTRRSLDGKQPMSEFVRLEKQRLSARISVMQDENRNYFYAAGDKVYHTLLDDLNQLSAHLDSTQANLLSKNFKARRSQEDAMVSLLHAFPDMLYKNLELFNNKVALDFYVLALKSRINSKIKKYQGEFNILIRSTLLKETGEYRSLILEERSGIKELEKRFEKIDHSRIMVPSANQSFESLFEEIRDLLKEVPEKIEIGGEYFADQVSELSTVKTEAIVVHLRKVLSFYLGKDFIDPAIRITLETDQQLQKTVVAIKDLVRLMNFSLTDDEGVDADTNEEKKAEQRAFMIHSFHKKLSDEETWVLQSLEKMDEAFSTLLKAAFDPLSSATISKSGVGLSKRSPEEGEKSFFSDMTGRWKQMVSMIQQQFVDLLYRRSEGMIWFRRLEESSDSERLSNRDTLDFIEAITPSSSIMKELPFYYCSLFSGQAGIGDDFWVGMEEQIAEADLAIRRFKNGRTGALIVTGVRSSGKSSLSKMMARKHFTSENIHQVRAPQGCTANVALFNARMLESLNATNKSIEDVFSALPAGKVIIIQDLALWWERKPGGSAVIEKIKSLIDQYGNKCLFIITVNSHALPLIDHWSKLKSFALATITCRPFDARELKEMILLRHRAGGLKLHVNKKAEDNMTAWDLARVFNAFFNQSFGNPGTAISLWLASIRKVSGKTIYLGPPNLPSTDLFDKMTRDQWFYILQFVIHRRFSAETLAENINLPREQVYEDLRVLIRAGILIERFQGIFAIRPGLDLFLTDKLKTLNRL